MWFRDASKELVGDLTCLLTQLLNEDPVDVSLHSGLRRYPELLSSCQRLTQHLQEQQQLQSQARAVPPAPCNAEQYQQLHLQLSGAEQQNEQLEQELKQCRVQLAADAIRQASWQQDEQAWELTKQTLTEGC